MPHILHDLSLEAEPDFENEAFLPLCNIIIRNDPNQNQQSAAAQLAEAHHLDHAQLKHDEDLAAQAATALQEQEEQERAEQDATEEAEKQEKEKKKLKMHGFNPEAMLKSFEFVELWYFMLDGCSTTSSENKSTASRAYTFTEDGPFLSLKSTALCRPLSRAVHDHDLAWRQFDLGKNNFLLHIRKLSWPQEHQASLTIFFMTIISHKSRTQPKGAAALLQYTLQVRHEWHDTLTNKDEGCPHSPT
ncbi:hypothetical protein PAXRUDRAFT_19265 [Paxillus rubicundulus Ve08.2h10]|uniref:Uncharacterized protein n=1 Tax=Paxillus rubicundulus Ve08.2h10 TaxID=930991 RepID=A0A0D0CIV6_9AGAM|nr:hypothetical protein PAXRUDRAFT_19265 [Paxillus rubicundulus Ve08.2h10]